MEKIPGFKEFLKTLTEELQKDSKRTIDSEKLLKAELAEIYALLDETQGFHSTSRLFGLYKKKGKKYSRKARKALESTAMATAVILGRKERSFDAKWRQRLLWTMWRLKRQTVNPEGS